MTISNLTFITGGIFLAISLLVATLWSQSTEEQRLARFRSIVVFSLWALCFFAQTLVLK